MLKIREAKIISDRAGYRSKELLICTSMLNSKKDQKEELGCLYACR